MCLQRSWACAAPLGIRSPQARPESQGHTLAPQNHASVQKPLLPSPSPSSELYLPRFPSLQLRAAEHLLHENHQQEQESQLLWNVLQVEANTR